jgi:drug/metabolite transporter (DMT)-like permease
VLCHSQPDKQADPNSETTMRSLTFLIFVAITFCCWGTYGPILHVGQEKMGSGGQLNSLLPFICVGIAYFLIAVIYPLVVLLGRGETGRWTTSGFIWSFAAGAVGAIGALGIILAFKFKGIPVYVMPLVFGCAPVVNTLVTMLMARTIRNASLMFYLGVLIVAIGAAGVLTFKPYAPKNVETEATIAEQSAPQAGTASAAEAKTGSSGVKTGSSNLPMVFLSILVSAICWGSYGPVLHKGQASMGGSRLRPFLCVGLAYFTIAVVFPLLLLPYFPEPGGWNLSGVLWSLLAGAVGAIGALGIIYAFNFGGKPIFVMPLVFGLAPVVNTFTEAISKGLIGEISSLFYASLLLVILGAVTVLVCAPRGKPKPAR